MFFHMYKITTKEKLICSVLRSGSVRFFDPIMGRP
jgi:hypothetical protein